MRELFKSILRFSWATVLLGLREGMAGLTSGRSGLPQPLAAGPPPAPLSVPTDTIPSPDPSREAGVATAPQTKGTVNSGRLNTSTFIVVGEGLAAGMGNFSLADDSQRFSFPALMADQMETSFDQPLIQPPGIGDAIGFAPWPVIVPSPLQSTVLDRIPPQLPSNLSVPGFTVSDALHLRPREPMIDRSNGKQTTANLILGVRDMAYASSKPLPTQIESAISRKPTLALLELGYAEALEAAVTGNLDHLPRGPSFREDYTTIVRELRSTGADVIVLTIPDPTNTAHFSSLQVAAPIVKLDVPLLMELWNLHADDLITVNGLNEISFQIYSASVAPSAASIQPLRSGSVLAGNVATRLQEAVRDLNQEIRKIASAERAVVYDLYALIKQIHTSGALIGGRTLTGDYLGGFYCLNGYYPGATGQALIANEILALLNKEFSASFQPVNIGNIMADDPVASYKKAEGPNWTKVDLTSAQPIPSLPPAGPSAAPMAPGPPQPLPASGQVINTKAHILQLPPGLEQVLPLNPELSYFGDALSAQNCRTPQTIQWGSGGNLLFGGLAMMDSHLSGNIRIKFTQPIDDWTNFEISFEQGLVGTDSVLAAPTFFEMAGKQQRVGNVPGMISGGRLNLSTGQVDPSNGKLNIYASFFNTALFALLRINPNFPTTPLSFPGPYGSATMQFDQRPDGKLDFAFFGSTFVPLGNQIRFPLNFCGPSRQFASIPANGTVLHPHISLSTKATQPSATPSVSPEIPFNTVQEFTLFTAISSFGDMFTLDAPQVGGPALGRSRLLGRVQIQFGPKSGSLVPIAISTTTAGGVLAPLDPTPIAQLFPGRLTPGPQGFYENLRFPLRTYSLNDLSVIDDPFDLSVAALDLRTGQSLQPILHRAFINQDLIFALLRVEPRTPKDSFFFRGFATLKNGHDGGRLFTYFGAVHIPYPPGFLFPDPNLATGFSVTGGGALDPYLWISAFSGNGSHGDVKTARADHVISSRGEEFSYRFHVSADPNHQSEFEFENHTQNGSFRMHSLTWVDSGSPSADNITFETVTFSGFGIWSKAGVERVVQGAVQLSTSPVVAYLGIQIGTGGEIANVNLIRPMTAFPVPT